LIGQKRENNVFNLHILMNIKSVINRNIIIQNKCIVNDKSCVHDMFEQYRLLLLTGTPSVYLKAINIHTYIYVRIHIFM